MPQVPAFGDYIVFVDESGDHGLVNIDPSYPVFVLCFCIFKKGSYADQVIPALTRLKFAAFGHDSVILHEHDIRRKKGPFSMMSQGPREDFLNRLTGVIEDSDFTMVAVVIRKDRLLGGPDPYFFAMQRGLERVHWFLQSIGDGNRLTHVLFECRGRREDEALELEFRRVCDGVNQARTVLPFAMQMVDKKSNSPGLQIADMTARPVGLMVLRPGQPNRTRAVLERKLLRGTEAPGDAPSIQGFGLLEYP